MEAVGQLAGGIAHDFNNILQVILGFSQLLELTTEKNSEDDSYIQEIIQAAKRASTLTNQLLTFSRRDTVERQHITLNKTVRETEGLIRMLLGEQIELALDLSEELYPIQADQGQLTQVIMNLAVNARDAMENSGGRLGIATENQQLGPDDLSTASSAAPGTYVCLSITDTGSGMAPEILDRLFEPFFTTKEIGRGSGLGLSVVYGIVQQNNGLITVQSKLNKGSCFKIYFPALTTETGSNEPKPASEEEQP